MNPDSDITPSQRASERQKPRRPALRLAASAALALFGMTIHGAVSRALGNQIPAVDARSRLRTGRFQLGVARYNTEVSMPVQQIVANGEPMDGSVVVGEARTSSDVSLRSGPGTGHSILRTVACGSAVNVSNTVQNGYRYVVYQGLAGWISDLSVNWGKQEPPAETFTTTANLNLRAEPTLSAKVLLVMSSGSTVAGMEGWANGFRRVSCMGTVGWAATCYLEPQRS